MSDARRDRPPPPPFEPVGADRREGLAAMLGAAFAADPAMNWLLPDAAQRVRRLPQLFRTLIDGDLQRGWIIASPDNSAATLWRPSEQARDGLLQTLRHAPGFVAALGAGLYRGLRLSAAIEAHFPKERPFHYLHVAGVDPAMQGRGLGGAAIRAGQARAQAAGRPIYLETATASNVGLYQALGFRVTQEWDVPGGGPHFWSMLWDPVAAH